jgi:hypothetical protein
MLNYDKLISASIANTGTLLDTTPFTILLSDGNILSAYSVFNSVATATRAANYSMGVVALYNPNNSTKFTVRSANTSTIQ